MTDFYQDYQNFFGNASVCPRDSQSLARACAYKAYMSLNEKSRPVNRSELINRSGDYATDWLQHHPGWIGKSPKLTSQGKDPSPKISPMSDEHEQALGVNVRHAAREASALLLENAIASPPDSVEGNPLLATTTLGDSQTLLSSDIAMTNDESLPGQNSSVPSDVHFFDTPNGLPVDPSTGLSSANPKVKSNPDISPHPNTFMGTSLNENQTQNQDKTSPLYQEASTGSGLGMEDHSLNQDLHFHSGVKHNIQGDVIGDNTVDNAADADNAAFDAFATIPGENDVQDGNGKRFKNSHVSSDSTPLDTHAPPPSTPMKPRRRSTNTSDTLPPMQTRSSSKLNQTKENTMPSNTLDSVDESSTVQSTEQSDISSHSSKKQSLVQDERGAASAAHPLNTGGTAYHIAEQPDMGLGGLTGKQPVGKIDLKTL
ncbi:hypothetical protein BDF14DRAFT_1762860 [Spinellus fusiger]|nr:hypothetical protein BDF14DRAFT_1762860 [Spinellus fusiger]